MKKLIFILLLLLLHSCESSKKSNIQVIDSNSTLQESLLQGWNTWNNPDLLSYVLMPDGISIRLSLRSKRGSPYWINEAYISSPIYNFPVKVKPIAHSYDGSYSELDFEWSGIKAKVQFAQSGNNAVILYTPLSIKGAQIKPQTAKDQYKFDESWKDPEDPCLLVLEMGVLWNKPSRIERRDSLIHAKGITREFDIYSTSKPEKISFPLPSPHYVFSSEIATGISTGRNLSIEEIDSILLIQKNKFEQYKKKFLNLEEAYEAMQAVVSWNVIYDAQNNRALVPVSRIWNETWGGYIIFDWDTYFTALMLAVDHKELAYSNAIAITHAITENGFVPNLEASFGVKSFDRSQPPVGSMICKLIYNKYKEKWFLGEVYNDLLTWNRWWPKERDNQGYLSWGSDPHPRGMDNPNTKRAGMLESGLDNSPLFDEAEFNKDKNVLELADVGLMSLYIADCKYLAYIADELGKPADVKELNQRAGKYTEKLNELWDESSGIYRDKYTNTGKFSNHLAPTNFYPLIAGVPSQAQAERMINEHFMNPKEFYGEWMIPSISRNDRGFKDNTYWRGRIWAPMNFLVYMGLRNYNLPEARKTLSDKSLMLILKEWRGNRRVFENYNSVTGVGSDVTDSDAFYSWGGLLGMIALMEGGYY